MYPRLFLDCNVPYGICLARSIPRGIEHGLIRTDNHTTSSQRNRFWNFGRNLALSIGSDTPQPGRFLCICTTAISMNSATRIRIYLFRCHCHHQSTMSQDERWKSPELFYREQSWQLVDRWWVVGFAPSREERPGRLSNCSAYEFSQHSCHCKAASYGNGVFLILEKWKS